jgi:class 3 adenylate cyclase
MAGDRDLAEAMSNASLVAMTLKGTMGSNKGLEDLAYDNSELAVGMASIAQAHGAEQLSSSAVTFLYATGLDVETPRIEDAVEFAIAAVDWLSETLESKGLLLSVAVGVASGDVVTGVMGTERLAVDVLGAPRQVAGALAEAAGAGQVLVDAEIAGSLGQEWQVDRVSGLEDLAGSPLDAWQVRSRTAV